VLASALSLLKVSASVSWCCGLLLLVRGYSMSHRYTTAKQLRQSQKSSRDTATSPQLTRGEGSAVWTGKKATERGAPMNWGPQRDGLVRTRTQRETIAHPYTTPSSSQPITDIANCLRFDSFEACREGHGAMLAEGTCGTARRCKSCNLRRVRRCDSAVRGCEV
jgi:hypothetical protein